MKIRWWALGFGFILLCLFLSVRYGTGPRSIRKIRPTEYENLEQLGATMFRRLYVEAKQHKVFVFGSSPFVKGYEQVWSGFIKTAMQSGVKVGGVLIQPELNFSSTWPTEIIDFGKDMNGLSRLIEEKLKNGAVFIHSASVLTSHAANVEIVKSLELQLAQPVMAFSQQIFVTQKEDLDEIVPTCDENSERFQLECAGKFFSETHFRKKYDKGKTWGAMEQIGRNDYIVYIHQAKNK